jgi:type IV pilus assembly protein PilE
MMIRRHIKPPSSGFTLVELMIVVLVASILIGISVPMYQNQVRHSRRTDAKTAVLDAAVREEKYLTLNNSYTITASKLGYAALPVNVGSGQYYQLNVCLGTATITTSPTVSCTAATAPTTGTSFVVSAIPVAGTSQAKDSNCLYFAVDNTGTQYSSNSTAGPGGTETTSTCWQ